MTEVYLFIGGSRDGQRLATKSDRVQVAVLADRPIWDTNNACFEYEYYKQFRIQADKTAFLVYALDSMKPDEIVARLIAQYAPIRPNNSLTKQDARRT